MNEDFYNTIYESGTSLTKLRRNAEAQQEKILWFFYINKGKSFIPFEIQKQVLPGAPITSVRRAITNLTKEGQLSKTNFQVEEQYGVKNFKWRYRGFVERCEEAVIMNLFGATKYYDKSIHDSIISL